MNIIGYDYLGENGKDGLRLAWQCDGVKNLVESAAFVNRSKNKREGICGYTTSVSSGCILKAQACPCVFCRTGRVLPFSKLLSSREIALQNVFMVLADIYCDDHPELKNRAREFAYMGQGEPGFSYVHVRQAIEITNRVMRKLNQKVYRHVFATSGVPDAIRGYLEDVQDFYTEKVTLHLSVHSCSERDALMPINRVYPLKESLDLIKDIKSKTGEKACVGIMLFKEYTVPNVIQGYTNGINEVRAILELLNPHEHRLSFCEYNPIGEDEKAEVYGTDEVAQIMALAEQMGFETKYFSSFGREKKSACGMLGGKEPENKASKKWKELEAEAKRMIEQCL